MDGNAAALQQVIAAWVQAVGSIVAIFAAIGIAWWQRREDRRHELQQAASEERRLLLNALKIGNEVALMLRAAFDLRMDPTVLDTPDQRAREIARLEYAIMAISTVPLHLLPSINAIGALMELRAIAGEACTIIGPIQGQRAGHPSYAAPFATLINRAVEQEETLAVAVGEAT